MISIQDALKTIDELLSPLKVVKLPIIQSAGYYLASDVLAQENAPFFSNSAMDGYCINYKSYSENQRKFVKTLEIQAGASVLERLENGTIARIFTGAPLPEGADTVIKQEDCEVVNDEVVLPDGLNQYDFVRKEANDFLKGELLLKKGQKLNSAKVALLASQGIYHVEVYDKANIAYVVSGNELRFENDSMGFGQIRSCNGEIFESELSELSHSITNLGVVRDDKDSVKEKLSQAENYDLFLISGGASVGEYDFTKEVLLELGYTIHFKQVAIRPGKPVVFATKGKSIVFGIPGNPVSTFVATKIFLKYALVSLCGSRLKNRFFRVKLGNEIKKPSKFEFYLRGNLIEESNQTVVYTDLNQSSGALGALARAECLVRVPVGVEKKDKGELTEVMMISE
ncbi:MAG: molybdopterin molybdotransferase MoeA [Candidatus Cloacimonetes bacterium]|nr:molybdopterin molybdotransferase MoeA [Candidatus Cloacimonadota bacterium]